MNVYKNKEETPRGLEPLLHSRKNSRSNLIEKGKFSGGINEKNSKDTSESDNEDDVPFIIYSERIKIDWPIFIFEKEDKFEEICSQSEKDAEISIDVIRFEGKHDKQTQCETNLSNIINMLILRLKSVRINLLPGFARKYIYNRDSNALEFRFKLVSKEASGVKDKVIIDLVVRDRLDELLTNIENEKMDRTISTNYSLKKNYGKDKTNLRQYSINIYKNINERIQLVKDTLLREANKNEDSKMFEVYIEKE
ncbi:hypothetical protein FG379_001639, partial [Cryptosporidium bovis]|uniref:uncharacterized protein n=1 Tax=Cryptosporidium bovis TaxID=310047 RepID=UPI003519F97B